MPAIDAGYSNSLPIFRGHGPLLRNLMLSLEIYLLPLAWFVKQPIRKNEKIQRETP
jgi:hypothetical protein